MIRWSYVLPRLLALVAVLAFIAFGLDPLIRWMLIRTGQRVVGAQFEVDQVRTSLSGAKLRLDGVRGADPDSPMRNLFEADAVYLDLDARALLLRRLVVERAQISGLRLDTERATSGALPESTSASEESESSFAVDQAWLKSLAEGALAKVTEDFESIELIESADERWKQRVSMLKERVAALKRRAQQFKDRYRNFNGRDPRAVAELLRDGPREIAAMQREVDLLQQEIGAFQRSAEVEFNDLAAARDRDLDRWRDRVGVPEFNAVQLSSYLLGPTLQQRLDEAMQWVNAGQALAKEASAAPNRTRSDEVIRFGQYPQPPDWLIRELIVDGQLSINQQPCQFSGVARDIAYPPTRHERPTTLQLQTRGDVEAQIVGRLDYRGEQAVQQFRVDVPDLVIPSQRMGKADSLSIAASRGRGSVRCEATLIDGRIHGHLVFHQSQPQLTVETGSPLGPRVQQSLSDSLGRIEQLNATLHFEGDPRAPRWKVESDLGRHVAQAARDALQSELTHQQQRLEARLNEEITERLDRFQQRLKAKQEELLADLNLDAAQLEQLLQSAAGPSVGQLQLPLPLPINQFLRR